MKSMAYLTTLDKYPTTQAATYHSVNVHNIEHPLCLHRYIQGTIGEPFFHSSTFFQGYMYAYSCEQLSTLRVCTLVPFIIIATIWLPSCFNACSPPPPPPSQSSPLRPTTAVITATTTTATQFATPIHPEVLYAVEHFMSVPLLTASETHSL